METIINCPFCRTAYQIAAEWLGRKGECVVCNRQFIMWEPTEARIVDKLRTISDRYTRGEINLTTGVSEARDTCRTPRCLSRMGTAKKSGGRRDGSKIWPALPGCD